MQPLLKNWLSRNNNPGLSLTSPATTGLVCLLAIVNSIARAQTNLVPNPSFEYYSNCPSASSQLSFAFPWYSPPNNDGDYFNSCSNNFGLPVIYNDYSLYARTGNGCAAIWGLNNVSSNYREYLQVELNESLEANKCYLCSFFVVLIKPSQLAIGDLAISFSEQAVLNTGTGDLLNLTSDIYCINNNPISDTLNWINISGIFSPNQSKKFLTIGNFKNDSATITSIVPNGTYPGAYYFVDDVSVNEISSPSWSYPDTNVIIGDSVFIGNLMSGLNCTWYLNGTAISNAPGFYVSPTGNSSYIIEMNICGNLFYDTVNVNVQLINVPEISTTAFEANIYPNPTPGEFSLELPKEVGGWQVTITDVEGRIILVQKVTEKTTLTKLIPDAENGVYLVYITNSFTNATVVKKLVIQK